MKCLERNKVTLYYCLYDGTEDVLDDNDNIVGKKVKYGSPIQMRANVSASQGESQIEQFGNSVEYDKVIIVDNCDLRIDENTVFIIDTTPTLDSNGNPNFDYIVRKVARSLNTVSIAISKVR